MNHNATPAAIQRCDRFVARTMNWMYDHLLHVPRYRVLVVTDELQHRDEFPELTAWSIDRNSVPRRIVRRLGIERDWLLARRLRRQHAGVLHSHFGYVGVDDYPLWKRLDVPWVISFYGADVYELSRHDEWRTRYERMFRGASRVLSLGPVMATHLERLGCPRAKLVVHPLGVNTDELPASVRQRAKHEPLKVLFAGTYREKKGIPYVIRAIRIARDEGVPVELHLVAEASTKPGDVETMQQVDALISDLDLEPYVTRYSMLPFKELIALARRCHIFAAPSVTAGNGDSEGTPFVLQQMMATGMPVIATRHSDIPYIFGNLADLLVPEHDAAGIATRIIEYARTPALMTEHGRLLRERMVGSFDGRACAAKLANIYDEVRDEARR